MLKGDLNEIQYLALQTSLIQEDQKERRDSWQAFKLNAIAAHPELAKVILEMSDEIEPDSTLAPVLEDQEMEDMGALTVEELDAAVDVLEEFGLRMEAP